MIPQKIPFQQSPGKPDVEANEPSQSETNENEPNHSQIQSDVFLIQYPKLHNQSKNLEELVEFEELTNQVEETAKQQEGLGRLPPDIADQPGQLDRQPSEKRSGVIKQSESEEIEKESDVVILEFLSEHEQQANEDMNKILNNLNKSSISIKETPSYDDQSAKSNQQFMEEQIESDDFIKQSISVYDNEDDSSGSQPSNKELLEVTKGFFKLPQELVEEDESHRGVQKSIIESQPVEKQEIDLSHLDIEYTGPVRSIFGPEPIRDYPNSLEELLSGKPREFHVPCEIINFNNDNKPYISSNVSETQKSANEGQVQPPEDQVETVAEAQSTYEPNYDIVIGSKEIVVEPKISSGDNMLKSNETKIEKPSVTGELTEPKQERYNDLKKLNEILKAGLETAENNEPKKSGVQQDNPELNAPEPNTEETDETLLIGGQVVNPSRLIENHPANNQNGVSRQLQIESSSRHSDPGATDAGTRKAFKEEIKYLSGHPQFRYLDAVSSATNVQKNSGEETTDLPGGGKSGDGTLNVGTNISKVSQVGREKSKVSLSVEHTSTSNSLLYQDSQITVKKPKHQESGISQMDNRSGNFDSEHRDLYSTVVEHKRLVETGPVIKDGDDAANGTKQIVIVTSDRQKVDIEEVSETNIGDFAENSASMLLDQSEMKKSATSHFQTKQGSTSEPKIKEQESNMEQTSKMKVRVEFKELQNPENQETEILSTNEQDQAIKQLDEHVTEDKSEGKDAMKLTSSNAIRSASSQLLRPLGSNLIAELSVGHLQAVNHPSVYSIYMQPNSANTTQAQNETVGEFKLAQHPQRISNENIPLKSIKKSSVIIVADQRLDSTLNDSQSAPVMKRDSVGTPEISRTMKKGNISEPDPKVSIETESTVMNTKIEEKEKAPDKQINLDSDVKPSKTAITVAGAVPKAREFESKIVIPDTKTSALELKNKISNVQVKKDESKSTLASTLTGTKSDVSKTRLTSDEKIVTSTSILHLKQESSEVDVDTKAEQPPIKLKVSEPFSKLLKQDSVSKIPEPIPKEQRGRVLTTPDTKRRTSKELFSRPRSGSVKKSSKSKTHLVIEKDRKKSTSTDSRAVIFSDHGHIRRTKLKKFTEAFAKFFNAKRWFKKRSSK